MNGSHDFELSGRPLRDIIDIIDDGCRVFIGGTISSTALLENPNPNYVNIGYVNIKNDENVTLDIFAIPTTDIQ